MLTSLKNALRQNQLTRLACRNIKKEFEEILAAIISVFLKKDDKALYVAVIDTAGFGDNLMGPL